MYAVYLDYYDVFWWFHQKQPNLTEYRRLRLSGNRFYPDWPEPEKSESEKLKFEKFESEKTDLKQVLQTLSTKEYSAESAIS